jgi:hypothetical protein
MDPVDMDEIGEPKPKRRRLFWLLLLIIPLPFGAHWYVTVAFLLISVIVTILLTARRP